MVDKADLFGLVIGLGVIAILILAISVVAIVPAGNVGIEDTFGSVSPNERQPGFHLKLPWQAIVSMTTKTQEIKEIAEVPSQEGLIVTLETSILYKIDPSKADEIYKTLGTNYPEVIIKPQLRSAIREITARYETKALYTRGRELVALEIHEQLEPQLSSRGIVLEQVLLRGLGLPEKVMNAIEAKLEAEQDVEKQAFLVEKEKQEAARKKVEAEGIAEAQRIIEQSLTTEYLQWYWLTKLNENPNVVYVATEAGLPMFRTVN